MTDRGHLFLLHGDPRRVEADAHAPHGTVESAALALSKSKPPPKHGRERPIVVVPLDDDGAALRATVERFLRVLGDGENILGQRADVALVTPDLACFTAAQAARRTALGRGPSGDEEDERSHAVADLAARALRDELVLFIGAGVSSSAGIPDWITLIRALARKSKMDDDEIERLANLPILDQAALLERRYLLRGDGARRELRKTLAEMVRADCASISHHLLAALPSRQLVTTNYDRLLELASEGTGRRTSVLPHARVETAERWLLKLHGCVSAPDDIVFTREDYLRYEQRHVALAGVMQALLFTQHVLFVGFSLNDDNFHRIADAVRRASVDGTERGGERKTFGTALVIEDEPLRRELWAGDLRWISLHEGCEGDRAQACAARRLEIFLDDVLAAAWPTGPHVLDTRYHAVLTSEERRLRSALERLVGEVGPDTRRGAAAAWSRIARALDALGAR